MEIPGKYYDQGGSGSYALGRLTKIEDPTGSTVYTYDKAGRVKTVAQTTSSVTYTTNYNLDADGQLASIEYPSGRVVQQSYDAVGQLTQVSSGGTNFLTIPSSGYDAFGHVLSETFGNSVTGAFSYSLDRAQLSSLAYAKSGANLFALNYYYSHNSSDCASGTTDDDGLIDCIQDTVQPGRSISYTYDAVGRLATARTAGSSAYPQWGLSWTYDSYGNRLSQNVTVGSATTNSVSVNASTNHISTAGYAYDAAGNMTGDGTNTITYDDAGRVISSSGDLGAGSYAFDGDGMRVKKTVSGSTTVYIYSGSQVIAEYASGAAATSPTKEFIYAGGTLPFAEIDNGSTVEYDQADTLSVRMVTNSSGTVLEQQGDYPYGEMWYQSASDTDFQFSNYLRDSESDNDYAYAREYVNRLARFSALDPIGGNVGNPLSWDRYSYVLDDPINDTDTTGMSSQGSGNSYWQWWSNPYGMAYSDAPPGAGCMLDGAFVSCGFAYGLAGQENGVYACPYNACTIARSDPSNGGAMEVADYAGGDGYEVISDWTQAEYQAYMHPREAAAVLALLHAAIPVLRALGVNVSSLKVAAWMRGFTLNIQFGKNTAVSAAELRTVLDSSYFTDIITFNHHGDKSFVQLLRLFHSGHWVADKGGLEFHVNPEGPLNPLHLFDFITGLFGRQWTSEVPYTCTPTLCK